jgi:hypothetical protein
VHPPPPARSLACRCAAAATPEKAWRPRITVRTSWGSERESEKQVSVEDNNGSNHPMTNGRRKVALVEYVQYTVLDMRFLDAWNQVQHQARLGGV